MWKFKELLTRYFEILIKTSFKLFSINKTCMNTKKFLKDAFHSALSLYVSAYMGLTGYEIYDAAKRNIQEDRKNHQTSNLDFHSFEVDMCSETKSLTLVGEVHLYNKTESKIARELVAKYKLIASETGMTSPFSLSFGNFLYSTILTFPLGLQMFYYQLGSDRWHSSIRTIANNNDIEVLKLESPNNGFNSLSSKERIMFLGEMIKGAALAPIIYFDARSDNNITLDAKNFPYYSSLVEKRDIVMANSLIRILEDTEADSCLAAVGDAHLPGIIDHLKKHLCIEEVK